MRRRRFRSKRRGYPVSRSRKRSRRRRTTRITRYGASRGGIRL